MITYEYAIKIGATYPMILDVYGTEQECHAQLESMGYDPSDWQLLDCMER